MIIEINYVTVLLIGVLLSAFGSALWFMGRTFLTQYSLVVTQQLETHLAGERKSLADLKDRLDRLEVEQANRLSAIDKEIDALQKTSSKALTHNDLDDLYVKVNLTSNSVSKMEGLLSNVNETLRMILARIAEKGLS